MARRLVDVILAAAGLLATVPLLLLAALGIRVASAGPVLYRARRVGRGGAHFTMYKLRTMHVRQAPDASVITASGDPRVFPLGAWLRRTKVDELPQLWNVLRGEMSIVGPRPEDPGIVDSCYTPLLRETLAVLPGLASPGSIYNMTHGERLLRADGVEDAYRSRLLPLKVALDVVYVRRATLRYDAVVILRTGWAIAGAVLGRRTFPEPPEMAEAMSLLGTGAFGGRSTAERGERLERPAPGGGREAPGPDPAPGPTGGRTSDVQGYAGQL